MVVLKSTVVFGYVDANATGCRALLGAQSSEFITSEWHLDSLDTNDDRTKIGCLQIRNGTILSKAHILTHRCHDVSLLILTAAVPDDISHVVANEILHTISKNNVKNVIILSAFATGSLINECLRVSSKDLCMNNAVTLQCQDVFLNSLIQCLLVEKLSFTLFIVDGRKPRFNTFPNKEDGSLQCIEAITEAVNKELDLGLEASRAQDIKYMTVAFRDDSTDSIYL